MTSYVLAAPSRYQYLAASDFLYIEDHSAGYKRPVIQPDVAGFIKPYTPLVRFCLPVMSTYYTFQRITSWLMLGYGEGGTDSFHHTCSMC